MSQYLQIKGAKQGEIKGSSVVKGHEGQIDVLGASHRLVSPRDRATGQASGKRFHDPFTITKMVDSATPPLYTALVTNESMKDWTIEFTGQDRSGKEIVIYRVKLTDAAVSEIHLVEPLPNLPNAGKLIEDVSFVYRKIEWTWVPTNATATDDWLAP